MSNYKPTPNVFGMSYWGTKRIF